MIETLPTARGLRLTAWCVATCVAAGFAALPAAGRLDPDASRQPLATPATRTLEHVAGPTAASHHPGNPCEVVAPPPPELRKVLGGKGTRAPRMTSGTSCYVSGPAGGATIYHGKFAEARAMALQLEGLYATPKRTSAPGLGSGAVLINNSLSPFDTESPAVWFFRRTEFVIIVGNGMTKARLLGLAGAVYHKMG